MKKIRIFLSENFQFFVVEFSVNLNRHVFVMTSRTVTSKHHCVVFSSFLKVMLNPNKTNRFLYCNNEASPIFENYLQLCI